jgi:solute carrier family 25 (mitochondrial carnitine/acylcarnitine transporter), member 20/29
VQVFHPDVSLLACLQQLYAEGGIGRFYKGFTPAIIRAAPANGVMLATVDKVTYWLADK